MNKPDISFGRYLFTLPANKRFLTIALAGTVLQFIVFKWCYPYADFFTDAYTYINAAAHDQVIGFRPPGYSRFLSAVHALSHSDTFLVFIQYFLIQAAGLYFFFSIGYFFRPSRMISILLFIFLAFNPAWLYISNFVTSDAIFLGLSLVWFTQLCRIIYRPAWYQVFVQAVLLLLIFELRYIALYFPLIACVAFLLSRQKWTFRLSGITLSVVAILGVIYTTKKKTYEYAGTNVFTGFSGWQLANNALNMYSHIEVDSTDFPSEKCRELDRGVRAYFKRSGRPQPNITTDYIWNAKGPLKQYLYHYLQMNRRMSYFKAWIAVSPVFSDYGSSLIEKHPVAFARYYLWPNTRDYFLPPLEAMRAYNEGSDSVDRVARDWFGYPSLKVTTASKTLEASILWPFPPLFFWLNIVFIFGYSGALVTGRIKTLNKPLQNILLLAGCFFLATMGFSIFAAPIIFRYQLFPLALYFCFSLLILSVLAPEKPGPRPAGPPQDTSSS